MIIITDTREQRPFDFSRFSDVEVETASLATGDYSIKGFESVIACERKELNDLIACLQGGNRTRFEKELSRAAHLHHFWILVEGSLEDISRGRYRSEMSSKAALQSIYAFMIRHKAGFVFCGNREGAEYTCYSLLSKFLREIQERFKRATKAQGFNSPSLGQ